MTLYCADCETYFDRNGKALRPAPVSVPPDLVHERCGECARRERQFRNIAQAAKQGRSIPVSAVVLPQPAPWPSGIERSLPASDRS